MKVRVVVAIASVAVAACIGLLLTRIPMGIHSSGVQPEPPPLPSDLYAVQDNETVVSTQTRKIWYSWGTNSKEVRLIRSHRSSPSVPWTTDEHVVSSSFLITSVSPLVSASCELSSLYVSATYGETGIHTIERWTLQYGGAGGLGGFNVTRSILYQGTTTGFISAVAIDHANQTLLALSHDERIYKLNPSSGPGGLTPPQLLFDTTTLPSLDGAKNMIFMQHVTEGSMWVVTRVPKSVHLDVGYDDPSLVLRDANSDGAIDATETMSSAEWEARGYYDGASWIRPCRE